MTGWEFWVLAVLAAVCVGLAKGGLMHVGVLSVPLLSLVISPVAAAGLLLPIYVVSDVFGVWSYWRGLDRKVFALVAPGLVIGVAIGWATASYVPERVVTGLVGIIGATFALSLILRRGAAPAPRPADPVKGLFWSTIAGFTSFVSHAGGPPYQVFVQPLGLSKLAFAGTATVVFAFVNAVKLVPYWALGQITTNSLSVAAWLMVPAVLSVFAGLRLVRVIPEQLFFRLVTWSLLAVSLRLMWQAAAG